MPELPEVETMKRGIAGILGSRIMAVERCRCRLRPIAILPSIATLRRRAVGREIVRLDRVGKRVVVWLDSREALIFEPRMTGLVLIADPPNQAHLRLRFQLAPKAGRSSKTAAIEELLYWDRRGLGHVRLVNEAEFEQLYRSERIGPDALIITCGQLRERLGTSRRAVKVALLDQRAVAGVGNLYASELLHLAGVSPERSCDQLTAEQWRRVHAAMRRVLLSAIRYEGSTLADGTYRNALNKAGGYQNHHRVYDRQGSECPGCGAAIVRIVQAQRATFYCPGCQV